MKKAIILLMAVGILSCNGGESETDKLLAVLDAEQAAWKALGISDYRFTAEISGSSQALYTVTIRPDTEPEIKYVGWNPERWEEVHTDPEWKRWHIFSSLRGVTIDELYLSMRERAVSIASDDKNVEIRYNKKYHYPEEFHFWPSKTGVDGGWYYFEIKEFKVLGSSEAGN